MAFDAGMVSAITYELNHRITDARVEKVLQPERDEIVLLLHAGRENLRLVLSAGTNNPRFHITSQQKENPTTAPMFCMLLRKHLTGSRVTGITQLGFERAVEFAFDCMDELGYRKPKYLVAETMGKYSNIILLDSDKKVISALRIIDLSASSKRQILPGFVYELPPKQNKMLPLEPDRAAFDKAAADSRDLPADKFLAAKYYGLSALTAREIACRAAGRLGATVGECGERLYDALCEFAAMVNEHRFEPWLVREPNGRPVEYSFFRPTEYGGDFDVIKFPDFGSLLDEFFVTRDRAERIKQRTSDIFRLLTNAETRLQKKIALQKSDLADCAEKENYKLWGDLVTANIWRLKRGDEEVELDNYYSEDGGKIKIKLDKRLSPQQNAQRFYKKYAKCKTAEVELARQIKLAEAELDYIYTVFDSLTRAESESDILEIRDELYRSGYASRMKSYAAKKLSQPKLMEFRTTNGLRVLCGKNNHQNDWLTTRVASKSDYWFHVKNQPGSHCVLFCEDGEPTERDFTEAATIAAYYSKASDGQNVPVDYTLVKNVRKPNGSKPGFVIYTTNYTAYVTPDERLVMSLRK